METDSALKALESFVVDNDDLLRLEERIGRFNIFDALGVARAEIRHSNFLAWLLHPSESHGQGSLFLKAVLMDLLKGSPPELRPFSPVELDGTDLRGVDVRREWRNIDILVTSEQPRFVLAIENKIDATEHSDQLKGYTETIETEFPDTPSLFVFLTRTGDTPSLDNWVPYSYADVHRVLTRCRATYQNSIGEDVLAFLDHYLRLIGSRFMDDKKIDDLCMRIYRNHRQALDLVFERLSAGVVFINEFEEVLASDPDRWYIYNRTAKRIDFVPTSWLDWIPPLCTLPRYPDKYWIHWKLRAHPRSFRLHIWIGSCRDNELREKLIRRLTDDHKEFGLSVMGKIDRRWTRLYSQLIAKRPKGWDMDGGKLRDEFQKRANRLLQRLEGVGDALKPILAAT